MNTTDLEGNWVTFGVIVNKSETKNSSNVSWKEAEHSSSLTGGKFHEIIINLVRVHVSYHYEEISR